MGTKVLYSKTWRDWQGPQRVWRKHVMWRGASKGLMQNVTYLTGAPKGLMQKRDVTLMSILEVNSLCRLQALIDHSQSYNWRGEEILWYGKQIHISFSVADQNIHLHCMERAFESLLYDRLMNKYEKVTFWKWAKCEDLCTTLTKHNTIFLFRSDRSSLRIGRW